jgi:dTDP-glucose 4,6-dehydratase
MEFIMNILITGCNGTLGKSLQRELIDRGYDVYGCDLTHGTDDNYMRCDISEYRQLLSVLNEFRPNYIFNLAAEFGRKNSDEYYEPVWKTNAIGMRNILELQTVYGFRLIHASSSEVYGNTDVDPITEYTKFSHPQNDYAMSKVVNEWQIENYIDKYPSQVVVPRFFNAYGPGEYYTPCRSVVCLFCYRALHDIRYEVYEDYHRTIMYIDDFIPTLANCIEYFNTAEFINGDHINIGGNEYLSTKDISDEILRQLGKDDSLVNYLPKQEHTTKNKRPDITKAKELLGHNPTVKIEEGISKTLDWMKQVYNATIR